MSSPNQRAEPRRVYSSGWIRPSEPVAEHTPSRIQPTGYGPYWPLPLRRGFLRWRQRKAGQGPPSAASLRARSQRELSEQRHGSTEN